MFRPIQVVSTALLTLFLAGGLYAIDPGFADKLNAEARSDEDKSRDAARKPYEVLTLLSIQSGMTVVDVAAGAGWYTEVLSAAVGPEGRVISQTGPRALQGDGARAVAARAQAERLGNVEVSFEDLSAIEAGVADMAVTALNFHDFANRGDADGTAFVTGIFNVLKPGGRAVIIDHQGNAGMDNVALHRMEAAEARRLIELAGFEVVAESNILNNPADDRTRRAHDADLERNTDRFLFVVQKP